MNTSAVIALAITGLFVLVAVVLLLRKPARGPVQQRLCGGCRRVMRLDWAQCLFCGWQVPVTAPRLEFVVGPLSGQTVALEAEVTTIGSVAGNTVVLSDPAVSRKHLGIRRMGQRYELADLGSTNGVYINGHRMAKKLLEPGDIMRVGNTEMVFRVE